jgi:hypothetical protein
LDGERRRNNILIAINSPTHKHSLHDRHVLYCSIIIILQILLKLDHLGSIHCLCAGGDVKWEWIVDIQNYQTSWLIAHIFFWYSHFWFHLKKYFSSIQWIYMEVLLSYTRSSINMNKKREFMMSSGCCVLYSWKYTIFFIVKSSEFSFSSLDIMMC